MAPLPYGEILARNVRAARSRLGTSGRRDVAARMQALGFHAVGFTQTVFKSPERNDRRLLDREVLGLALALETSMPGTAHCGPRR